MDFAIVHVHSCYTDIQADCASICSLLLFVWLVCADVIRFRTTEMVDLAVITLC